MGRRQAIETGDNIGLIVNRALLYRDGGAAIELMPPPAATPAPIPTSREEISA
jgi:hypothetical protein